MRERERERERDAKSEGCCSTARHSETKHGSEQNSMPQRQYCGEVRTVRLHCFRPQLIAAAPLGRQAPEALTGTRRPWAECGRGLSSTVAA